MAMEVSGARTTSRGVSWTRVSPETPGSLPYTGNIQKDLVSSPAPRLTNRVTLTSDLVM